jgi:hypothetical protein
MWNKVNILFDCVQNTQPTLLFTLKENEKMLVFFFFFLKSFFLNPFPNDKF